MIVPAPHLVERRWTLMRKGPGRKVINPDINQPIFTGEEGKVTQAPEGERVKRKVILEYSCDEVSESPAGSNLPRVPNCGQHGQDKEGEEKCKADNYMPPHSRGPDRFVHHMV